MSSVFCICIPEQQPLIFSKSMVWDFWQMDGMGVLLFISSHIRQLGFFKAGGCSARVFASF